MSEHLQNWATEKNKCRESCRIAYHALEPDAVGGLWSFQATRVQEVCCRFTAMEADKTTQMSAGALLTPPDWLSDYTVLAWMLKTTVNGFQPVRG